MKTMSILGLIIIIYCVTYYVVVSIQRSLTFAPAGPVPGAEEAEFGIPTPDGERLAAQLVPPTSTPNGRNTIYFHGNGGNMYHYSSFVKEDAAQGYRVLVFDYRGYGGSTGVPSETGLHVDADAVLQYAINVVGWAPRDIVLHGFSLGCGVALHLAARNPDKPFAGLLMEAPFASIKSAARHVFSGSALVSPWLARDFDNESAIQRISPHVPLAIAYTPHDEVVPAEDALLLYRASMATSRFLETSAVRRHFGVHARQAYVWLRLHWDGLCHAPSAPAPTVTTLTKERIS